jgi:phage-related protein|nr:MAG TPA: tail tape measure protein [Caudoviricetes sp.]
MAEGDGKVVIDTELDSSGAKDGIKGLSSSIASSAGGAVKSIAKIGTAAMAAGATATAALVKSSVDAYASYEQLRGGIETLFGAGGQSAKEYAKSVGKSTDEAKKDYQQLMNAQNIALKNADKAYKTAGMSANDYMETVTSFAASLKQSTKNETEAAKSANQIVIDMSDNANKMGTDMTMIQNAYNGFAKQNYTMLDNLKLGYGGTKSEMQRLLKDAEKLSGQKYELGNFKDMAEAIHVVQTEMGITGTTAKEASTTIEGSVNSAKAAWTNLVSGMSQDNADMDKLINEFIESVGVAAGNILPRVETALGGVGSLIEKLLPVIVDAIPDVIENLLPKLLASGTNIVLTLVQGIAAAIPSLLKVLNQLLNIVLEKIPNLYNSLSEFFSGDGASSIMNMVLTLVNQLATALIGSLPTILDAAINYLTQVLLFITGQIPNIVSTVVSIIPALVDGLLQAIPTLIQAIPPIIDALVNGLLACIPNIIDTGVKLITALVDNLSEIINTIVAVIPEIITNLVNAIQDHLPDIIDAGVELIGALVDNLPEIINTIVEAIPPLITALLNGLFDCIPDIVDAGFKLITALVDALPQIIITIVKAIPKIIAGIIGALVGAIPKIIATGFKLLISIIKNLPQIIAKIITAIPAIIKALIDGFGDYLSDMADIGLNLIKGLWNGIKNAGAWLRDKISGFFGGVVDSIKDFFGIASPSKLMRDQVGKFIAQGIWVGFNKEDPMDQINRDIRYGMKKLDTTMTLSGGYYSGIDYDKMAQATTDAFVDANIGVSVGNRQFGRLVREVSV